MIRSFGDRRTETLFRDQFVLDFQGIARKAKRKLEAINAASGLSDLCGAAIEPSGKAAWGSRAFYSIRINEQWRVIFRWRDGEPHQVRIVDYY
jgi:proteic killer suppression protein